MNPTLITLELDRVLAMIATEAKSAPGRAALTRRAPATTLPECERLQGELAEMTRFYLRDGQLPFSGLTDLASLREPGRLLDLEESWQALRAIRSTQAVRETFTRSQEAHPLLLRIAEGIEDLAEVIGAVGRYFTQEGKLREEASAELRSLRTRIHAKRNAIQRFLSDLMQRHEDAIQEPLITIRGERYCIPVRSESRTSVTGILHERSGSGATIFVEPMGAVEMNNDLAELLIQEREEIARITRFISQTLIGHADAILQSVEVAGELDAIQACAISGDLLRATRPHFVEGSLLRIIEGRHPLLDEGGAALRQRAFGEEEAAVAVVPVSLELNQEHTALLVTGPNAGGKTVSLKTAGLLVIMATSGLPVPAAEGTIIPVVDSIHVLIGDDQSLFQHLSTFSAYLLRLRQVLEKATRRSLVLLDELGSGTDPDEGGALASAVIEHFLATGSLLIVTTHLSSLKTFAIADPRIVNAGMEFDSATGLPTFRMITGVPGRSRALEVAEMMRLPPAIIRAAREKLGTGYAEIDLLVSELQRKMTEIVAESERIEMERAALRSSLEASERARAALDEQRTILGKKMREQLDAVREEVSRKLAGEIRRLQEADRASRQKTSSASVAESIIEAASSSLDLLDEAPRREIKVGDTVQHRRFKMVGQVVSIAGDRVGLSASGKHIQVSRGDLTAVDQAPKRGPAAAPSTPPDSEDEVAAELNLIGRRVDEAIDEIDPFLDRCLLQQKKLVRIIHGFGTGALRKGVREHLRQHQGVASYRPAEAKEGGDGATIVVLDV
jgi:DNA mismatch repair protein MutS2